MPCNSSRASGPDLNREGVESLCSVTGIVQIYLSGVSLLCITHFFKSIFQKRKMSQNCKSTYSTATTRDANNNTLYHGGATQSYGGRGYAPPNVGSNGNYKQVTAKVLFGSVTSINDLKRQEKAEREVRRTH